MSDYELIEILCATTSILADIARRQQAIIMQHGIDNPVADEAEIALQKLDRAEYELRRK